MARPNQDGMGPPPRQRNCLDRKAEMNDHAPEARNKHNRKVRATRAGAV